MALTRARQQGLALMLLIQAVAHGAGTGRGLANAAAFASPRAAAQEGRPRLRVGLAVFLGSARQVLTASKARATTPRAPVHFRATVPSGWRCRY